MTAISPITTNPEHIGLDIETDTSGVTPDGERTGLDPRYTPILSAALWLGSTGEFFDDESEKRLISNINECIMDQVRSFSTLITWNGANFDMPFIKSRSIMNGLNIGLRLRDSDLRPPKYRVCPGYTHGQIAQWGTLDHVDIMYAYKDFALSRGIRQGLKPVARALGFDPIEVDASKMELLSRPELRLYNLSDVRVTSQVADVTDLEPYRDSRLFL